VETKIKIGFGILVLLIISNLFTGAAYKSERTKRVHAETMQKATQSQLTKTAKALTEAEASSLVLSDQEIVRNADGSVFLDGNGRAVILTNTRNETSSRTSSNLSEAITSATASIESLTSNTTETSETITKMGVKKLGLMYGFKPFKLEHSLGAKFRQKVFMFEMAAGAMVPISPVFDYKNTMILLEVDFRLF